jgi:hypothetical protein
MGAPRLQQSASSSAIQMQEPVQQQQGVSYTTLNDFSSRVEIYKGRCAGSRGAAKQQQDCCACVTET